MDETTPLLPVALDEADAVGAELYGARKVACEREVESAFPGRALIIRPGIVAGPHDPTNRFTWWVERLARAGELLAPGSPDAPVQLVDGRDLGTFTVAQTERLATGVFNVCGPPSSFGELIEACQTGTASSPEVTWVAERLLLEQSVEPFTEMPLWLPNEPANRAFYSLSNARARAQGLELRQLADTARDTWEWLRAVRDGELPEPSAGGFVARGLTPEREAALLALHHST
jgi:2'-hydroxyisoflavone reductase